MAGALVGGAFLSAFLQVAFDRMASSEVLDFIKGKKLHDELLKKLEITLSSINAVLDDAEEKQFTNQAVKMWLDELKDAVYDAEDVLDEIATEVSKRKLDMEFQTGKKKVWNFISTIIDPFDKGIELKMKEILARLEYLENRRYVLALKGDVKQKPAGRNSPTASLVEESSVCGRDNDKETIMKLLLSDDASSSNKISVIAVVGLGGLGKTTLAQFIYNDNRVKEFFELRAWVCVSEEFDVLRVTKTVYEAVTSSTPGTKDLDLLQVELKEKLKRNKFLLVLDDVWNENYVEWEKLSSPFNFGAEGSKIIVTTRSERVASVMRTVSTYHLEQLSDEDCWLLFAKHAFDNGESGTWPTQLEVMGREIVKKCKGLPLAAKTLGGLLRTEQDPDEWDKILKSEIWDLSADRSNIFSVLRLSFHHLPSHLKRCFAYCSIFPKDYEFKREELILLWMAEDFLNYNKRNKTMEEVGAEYFDDLISRSFFQRSHDNESGFIMHDLVNDLAKYVSGEFCFRLEDDHSYKIAKKTRHLSYFRTRDDSFEKFGALYEAKGLRTFMQLEKSSWQYGSISTKVPNDLFLKLSCLRVLYLSRNENIHELPDSIGNLKHLRYLDLSYTAIKQLPDSMCDLFNLQTLNLSGCDCLTELPINIGRLINLHHLDIEGTKLKEMPLQLGRLKNLQTLTDFFLRQHSGSRIKELKEIQHLRGSLRILGLQNVIHSTDALEANIKGKKYLEELVLEWGNQTNDSQNERDVLDKLQPHTNLKKLSIQYFGGTRFPDWLGDHSFPNIVSLQLRNCKNCFSLPPLGQLPSLKNLSIEGFDGVVSVGPEFCGIGSSAIKSFGSLEILKFENMLEWQEWFSSEGEDEGGPFPQLRKLYIEGCPKLSKDLPNHLPQLIKLVIKKCQKLVATLPRAPAIRDLELTKCDKVLVKELPTRLGKLAIGGYDALESLPTTLQSRAIKNCDSLRSFILDNFPKLRRLAITDFKNLESISFPERQEHHLMSSTSLEVSGCHNLEYFGIFSAPNLTRLAINNCKKLKLLPERMHDLLPSLQHLVITYCPEVESFPEGGLPPSLSILRVRYCDKLIAHRMGWGLQRLPSLRTFLIRGTSEEVESFPEEGLLPCTLTYIDIWNFPNLKALDGKGLQHLTSLRNLKLRELPKLQSIPEEGLPTSLSSLYVNRCPLLSERCQRDRGEDWPKIANIPLIEIDGEYIQRDGACQLEK